MVSVGTYNIQKPDNTWNIRAPQIIENIKHANVDIFTFQEVTNHDWLEPQLKSLGYSTSSTTEKSIVAWKTNKFEVQERFSGRYTDGAARTRSFSAADLKDKTTDKVIRVASIHLYTAPRDGTAHLGIPQLRTFREQLESRTRDVSRIIIAGDYNADFDRGNDAEVLNILNKPKAGSGYAYHTVEKNSSGEKILTKGKSKIDHIFAGVKSPDAKSAPKLTHLPISIPHPNASDHLPHAINVHYEDVAKVERETKSLTQDPEVMRKLQSCFSNKTKVVRDDLINAGLVTRENCNQKTADWVTTGLIVQHGHGRDTYYTAGPNLTPKQETNPLASIIQRLKSCFQRKNILVRDDLISAGLVTRENCNQKTAEWVRQGLIVQHGHGKTTCYSQGPVLKPQRPNPPRDNRNDRPAPDIKQLFVKIWDVCSWIFQKIREIFS